MKNAEYITELQEKLPQSVFAFGLTNIGCIQEGITHHIVVPAQKVKDEKADSGFESPVHLSKRRGSKIDLIRVMNSFYELGYVEDETGGRLSKKDYFKAIGTLFNIDLSTYDVDLCNSMSVCTSMDKQNRVFDQLKKKNEDIFNSK